MSGILHRTAKGSYHHANAEEILKDRNLKKRAGKAQLVLTSPPFPLNKKKAYGNKAGAEYLEWFESLAPIFSELLTDDGSLVIELGNAWEPGRPVQSSLPLRCMLSLLDHKSTPFVLCQQFVAYNPARLPSPAQWVNVERSRVTDSYTNIWWLSRTDRPKADNRRVLRPYSKEMKNLLGRQAYNAGARPSEHGIGEKSFLTDNKGSISHNLFEMEQLDPDREVRLPNVFNVPNTISTDAFLSRCREVGIRPHPARMPVGLAAFFVEFLTERGDLVFDPFAGSNTTGYVAEVLGRRWVSVDAQPDYADQSIVRFELLHERTQKKSACR
tara:strand:- start:4990 stop:5970 length:981 start_codon:yes stop_codon:yes gene_type:complete